MQAAGICAVLHVCDAHQPSRRPKSVLGGVSRYVRMPANINCQPGHRISQVMINTEPPPRKRSRARVDAHHQHSNDLFRAVRSLSGIHQHMTCIECFPSPSWPGLYGSVRLVDSTWPLL
jgi:hypothetical protein